MGILTVPYHGSSIKEWWPPPRQLNSIYPSFNNGTNEPSIPWYRIQRYSLHFVAWQCPVTQTQWNRSVLQLGRECDLWCGGLLKLCLEFSRGLLMCLDGLLPWTPDVIGTSWDVEIMHCTGWVSGCLRSRNGNALLDCFPLIFRWGWQYVVLLCRLCGVNYKKAIFKLIHTDLHQKIECLLLHLPFEG